MKKTPVVHPFLLAVYPVLFLFSQNIAQVAFHETRAPMLITLGLTLAVVVLLVLIFKDMEKAGIIASLLLVLFFSFGHIFTAINQSEIGNVTYLLLIGGVVVSECVILALAVVFLKKASRNLHNLTTFLNVMASCLIVFSLFSIGVFGLKTGALRPNVDAQSLTTDPLKTGKIAGLPNIYYIILDAYARQDVLREIFDYSNEKFINYLVGKGFYVADKSAANYNFTQLSLASTLNYSYLDNLASDVGEENTSFFPLFKAIQNNRSSRVLEQHGYETAFIYSGGAGLEISQAPNVYTLERANVWLTNAFHKVVLNSTPIPYVMAGHPDNVFDELDFHREQVLYAFDKIVELSKKQGPIFVFAHILKPHIPFVFSEAGEPIAPHRHKGSWYSVRKGMDRDEYIDLYKKQLSFTNKKIMKIVEAILSNSSEPPIIILQADHGPTMGEGNSLADADLNVLLPILNAFYLPNDGKKHLYPTISPVNTFRVIFRHYLNADINLAPDRSYFALSKSPYTHYNVTEKIKEED